MKTEELAAAELLQRQEGSDITIDDLLALLAYAVTGDHSRLMEVRERGAEIGSVNQSAYLLRSRCRDALC